MFSTTRYLATAGALILLAAGCAGPSQTSSPVEPPGGTAAAGYPATIDNCGTQVTFEAAPERVVTIKSTATEMLLSLGLGSTIVGSAFADGPLPDAHADARIPVLSEQLPGTEATLALEPDLVYGGWESNFSAEGAGDRASLEALGVRTYVSPAACKAEGYKPDPLTFDSIFDDITEMGRIFGVEARADLVVSQEADKLAAITPDGSGLSALWYSSGEKTPYVGAGTGAPQLLMETVGLRNVAADIDDSWSAMSWEAVAAADPDVIVLVDAAWNTAQQKVDHLTANPATAKLRAVRESRYLTVPFAGGEAGVRSVDTARSLEDQLRLLDPLDP
ncbi:putative F420-0 ABC transporter substrate-binding protein [Arthrobacter sp. MSA 4-2]|uniref:putative F420-0 ABC transporter substrate-binding protein n=1 Tax=Arthrobacter sp. MSA 4-2 TaxID=2794349 RepID=UPI0018E6F222|nr:putative F420-0 ABC transporter substrate-binding protein [Arthrobacter sp. MSA 4-2]MBJ2122558.1 putative F420-0 ABC transporter substrate-binding protein [Arthrobacter sp. MSA 4-2]